jgi:hypothetical protein
MLTAYLACLIAGGVFVALSALSGLDKDADAGGGDEFGGHAHLDGHVHLDVDADLDADIIDAEYAVDGSHALADGSHGTSRETRKAKRWLPFLSFRFWTFSSCFFGLTGALLHWTQLTTEPNTAAVATAVGLSVGTALSYIIRQLSQPVTSGVAHTNEFVGRVGEVLHNLNPGGVTTVKLHLGHHAHEVIASSQDDLSLPKGSRVVILGFDEHGQAHISPESSLYHLEVK